MALLQVMVAAGLMVIIALGAASVMVDMNKSANNNRQRNQMESMHEEIRSLLSGSAACLNSLGPVNLPTITGANTVAVNQIRDNLNVVRFATAGIYGDRTTRIEAMTLRNFNAGSGDGGEVTLQIRYRTVLEQVGSQETIRTVNISTTRNVATGVLQSCVAMAKMSDGIWQRSTANTNDIFYNGRYAGIGTTTPASRLHVSEPGQTTVTLESTSQSNPVLVFRGNGGVAAGNGSGALVFSNSQVTGPTVPFWDSNLAIIQPILTGATATSGSDLMFVVKQENGPPRERMRLKENGGLGIGTSAPVSSLEIAGRFAGGVDRTIGIYPATASDTAGINFAMSKAAYDNASVTGNLASVGFAVAAGHYGNDTQAGDIALGSSMGRDIHLVTRIDADANGVVERAPNRLVVKNNGHIGIGTLDPRSQFHIENQDFWSVITSRTYSSILRTHAPAYVGLRGRGTAASPQYPLLNDTLAQFTGRDAIDGYTALIFGGADMLMIAAQDHSSTAKGTDIAFTTTALNAVQPAERIRITANGNVGINLIDPQGRLHVRGDVVVGDVTDTFSGDGLGPLLRIGGASSENSDAIEFRRNNYASDRSELRIVLGDNVNEALAFDRMVVGGLAQPSNVWTPQFTFNTMGRFGVGTLSPSEAVHVVGNLRVQGSTDCTLGNGAGGTSCSSDIRLKKNIRLIDQSLEKVASLRGVEFVWNDLGAIPGRRDIGVIAQDVEKSFPTAVLEDPSTGF